MDQSRVVAMLLAQVAKPQTKAAASSTNSMAPRRSMLVMHGRGYGSAEAARRLQWNIGNEAPLQLPWQPTSSLTGRPGRLHEQEAEPENMPAAEAACGAAWDFSRIPVFPRDHPGDRRTLLPPSAPPMPAIIQAKLVVGKSNDPLEHEADRVADQVMRMPDAELSIGATPLQINRKCAACEQQDEDMQKAQRKPASISSPQAGETPSLVHEVLGSSGHPLDAATRAYFEPRFGHDFSEVRVHTDGRAAASAVSIGASAYTAGSNIAFAIGRFDPVSTSGRRLLAHELTHVVQQRSLHPSGSSSGPGLVQRDSDSDDFAQGYQDGLSGDESHGAPRDGDALVDYNEGYAKGHYEFGQKSSSGGASGAGGNLSARARRSRTGESLQVCGNIDKGSLPAPKRDDTPCTPSPTVSWTVSNPGGGSTECWYIEYRCDVRTDFQKWADESSLWPGTPYKDLKYAGPIREVGCGHSPETGAEDPGRASDTGEWGKMNPRGGGKGGGGRR